MRAERCNLCQEDVHCIYFTLRDMWFERFLREQEKIAEGEGYGSTLHQLTGCLPAQPYLIACACWILVGILWCTVCWQRRGRVGFWPRLMFYLSWRHHTLLMVSCWVPIWFISEEVGKSRYPGHGFAGCLKLSCALRSRILTSSALLCDSL